MAKTLKQIKKQLARAREEGKNKELIKAHKNAKERVKRKLKSSN